MMSLETTGWKTKRYDDGREVLLKTVHCDNLKQSFELAHRIATAMIGTEAEKDFSVSADPTAVFVVLHAYSKDSLPLEYNEIAKHLDIVTNAHTN